ncbi:MAG: hypothetical protein ACKOWO_06430 [Sediminibacterium sp.]
MRPFARTHLIKLTIFCTLLSACQSKELFSPVQSTSVSDPVATQWLGFGYNQDPLDRNNEGHNIAEWDINRWKITKNRIDYIRPSFVRINLYRHWFNDSGIVGEYDWNSPKMHSLYQVLDYYKEKDIPVMTGMWQSTLDHKDDVPFYVSTGSDSFQQLQIDLFQHLYHAKGYFNIRWYTPTNEPKGMGMDFQKWSNMMRNTFQGFLNAKLPLSKFTGADSWEDWTAAAAIYNKKELSAYDHHYYLNLGIDEVIYGRLELMLKKEVAKIREIDSDQKPIFLSEVGFTNTSELDYWYVLKTLPIVNPTTWIYGLLALDYGIQVARSGESGALAWSLDGYDYGKDPGMWNIAGNNGGIKFRPWYYTWSMLCRYFPPGGTLYPISFNSNKTRGVSIEQKSQNKSHWSFAFVNWEEKEIEAQIKVPNFQGGSFVKIQFNELIPGDGTSLSLPKENIQINSSVEGFKVKIPANGGLVITSMENSPI